MNRVEEKHKDAYWKGSNAFADHAKVTKEVATGFAEFIIKGDWIFCYDHESRNYQKWADLKGKTHLTTEQLYDLYISTIK